MKKYQLSPAFRTISDPGSGLTMAFHALYGNPRILNDEGVQFLNLFQTPVTLEDVAEACDDDPEEVVKEFAEIYFLVESGFDEKRFLHSQKAQHLSQVSQGQTIDRMGLAISDSCNFGCFHCIHFQPSGKGGRSLPIYQKSKPQLNMWAYVHSCWTC